MNKVLTSLRGDAKKIFLQALRAADPNHILSSQISLRKNVLRVGKKSLSAFSLRPGLGGGSGESIRRHGCQPGGDFGFADHGRLDKC